MSERLPSTSGSDSWDSLELADYLDIAQRRKWWILVTAIAVSLCGGIIALTLPDIYRAETVIIVDPQKVPSNLVASIESGNIPERLGLIRVEVLSPARLKKLIDSMGLYPELRGKMGEQDLITTMQKRISVDFVEQGGVRLNAFRIGFLSRNPVTAAQVANQLASMFIDENLKDREQLSYGTSEFFESELTRTKKDMEEKEAALSSLKSRNLMDLPESKQYHIEALDALRAQLRASQDKVSRAQQQKIYLQSLMVATAPTVDLDTDSGASPHQQQIERLQAQLSQLESRYGPSYPDVRKIVAELSQLKREAAEEKSSGRAMSVPVVTPKTSRRNPVLEAQLKRLDEEIEEEIGRQKPLEDQIAFHVAKLQQEPIFEQKMAGLVRDYDTLKAHYTNMMNTKLSADTSTDLETRQKGEKFVILDPAQPPEKPYGPVRLLVTIGGLVGGLLAGCGLAFVIEMADESVRSERDLGAILSQPVLTAIPRIFTDAEIRKRRIRSFGVVAATVTVSVGLGFAVSLFSRGVLY